MSNQCRIDVELMPNRPLRGEGEADSRVGSRGSVPNKPLGFLGRGCFDCTIRQKVWKEENPKSR